MLSTLMVCCALAAPPADSPAAKQVSAKANAAFAMSEVESNIIAWTNYQRRRHGLTALQVDHGLMSSARSHCQWMAGRNSLQHTSAMVAENIAMGQSTSSEAVRDWMNSPGHRANLLGRGYSRIGVAAFVSPSGQIYWCQQFLH